MNGMTDKTKEFYDRQFLRDDMAHPESPEEHSFSRELKVLIDKYGLKGKRCLEVGCGRGAFQDLVADYTGTDLADAVRPYLRKPFYQASVTRLPFDDNEFDAIWTVDMLEHVPEPEQALKEMRRVLKSGGVLILDAAWYCRPWAAQGYPVRPYGDLDCRGKLIKASIPLRNSLFWRSFFIFPQRLGRLIKWQFHSREMELKYKPLQPNLEKFWMSDSDAASSIDPFEVILWFISRGDECLSYSNGFSRFCVRSGTVVFRINK